MPGARRAAAVGGQAAQGNGLGGVVGDGVGVLAGGTGGLAQAVERPRLAIPVTDLAENGEASVMMRRCLVSQAQADAGVAEAGERPGFANPIACLLEKGQGLTEMIGSLVRQAKPGTNVAETGQRPGFASLIAGLPVQGQCLPVEGPQLVRAAAIAGAPADVWRTDRLPAYFGRLDQVRFGAEWLRPWQAGILPDAHVAHAQNAPRGPRCPDAVPALAPKT